METDCLVVVQAIRCPLNMISYIGGIVQDCKTTLSSLTDVLLVFIKRSANNVAHEIARASNIVPDRSTSIKREQHDYMSVMHIEQITGNRFLLTNKHIRSVVYRIIFPYISHANHSTRSNSTKHQLFAILIFNLYMPQLFSILSRIVAISYY